MQTPGSLDALAMVLECDPILPGHRNARLYAGITIGNCGANSAEGAEIIVKHAGLMKALISCLANGFDELQETTVVALKNCAASSQEAAYIVAHSNEALALIQGFVLHKNRSRLHDVAVGAINCISRSPRAVPRLRQMGLSKVFEERLWAENSGEDSELHKMTLACAVVNIECVSMSCLCACVRVCVN